MDRDANVWKGLAGGALGGLLGALAMSGLISVCVKVGVMTLNGGEDSTVKTASGISERVLHRPLQKDEKGWAGAAVHYGFGATVGALYGAVSEVVPEVSLARGLPYGAAVWLGAHVIAVPAAGLGPPITSSNLSYEIVEFMAHLLYGAVLDATRRLVRSGHL